MVTEPLDTGIAIWIPIYMYFSLKNTYGQGYFLTAWKFLFLAASYWVLALLGSVSAALIGVMTL